MSSPAFAKTMELIKKGTLTVPDIVLGIRTMIGANPHHTDMLALIDDLVVEAKRLYLAPADVEGAERAAVVLDVVIALCRVRVTYRMGSGPLLPGGRNRDRRPFDHVVLRGDVERRTPCLTEAVS